MRDEGLGVTGGATYFLTSLLDHPDFTDEHLALMPFAGLGGSTGAGRRHGAARAAWASTRSAPTGAPSTRRSPGCLLDDPEEKRLTTDGHVLPGVELRPRRRRRDPHPRARTAASATPIRRSRPRRSTTTAGTTPATSGVLDDEGYLTITDRISDIIIRGGENISAQEVEELLMGMDAVAEASVVAAPDERLGERAAAIAAPARGRRRPDPRRRPGPPRPPLAWPARSGPSRCGRSTTSPAPRRARSRSSCSAASPGRSP